MSNDTPGRPVPMATLGLQHVVEAARAYSDARTREAGQEEMQKARADVAKTAADLTHGRRDAARILASGGDRYEPSPSHPDLYVDRTRFTLVLLVDDLYSIAAGEEPVQARDWECRDQLVLEAAAEHTLALAKAFIADAEAPA